MRLDLGPTLEELRAQALAEIDRRAADAAEVIRPRWLEPLDDLRIAAARAAGAQDAHARAVMDAANATAAKRRALDDARLAAKAAIRAATTVAEIRAVNLDLGA